LAVISRRTTTNVFDIKVWDIATRKEKAAPQGVSSRTSWGVGEKDSPGAVFSPDSKTLAYTDGTTVKLWDLTAGKEPVALVGHADDVECLAFNPDGTTLASGSLDCTVKLWDLATGKARVKVTYVEHAKWVNAVAFSPDGKILASSSGGTIELRDVATGKQLLGLQATHGFFPFASSLAFSQDGKTLASGGDSLLLWHTADGTNFADLGSPKCFGKSLGPLNWPGIAGSLIFNPNGKTLVGVDFTWA